MFHVEHWLNLVERPPAAAASAKPQAVRSVGRNVPCGTLDSGMATRDRMFHLEHYEVLCFGASVPRGTFLAIHWVHQVRVGGQGLVGL